MRRIAPAALGAAFVLLGSVLHAEPAGDAAFSPVAAEKQAQKDLAALRTALSRYYSEFRAYPRNPKELVPKYIAALPALRLQTHPKGGGMRVVAKDHGDRLDAYVQDTGNWLYFNLPGSPLNGAVVVDCMHRDLKGRLWWQN